ncbi:helix-turn-helix domain-containing protein [Pleomorphomonas carboxyditropha]|uniref:helix-turn-helix domain-containing protein n=1 Tax=Pleomorphomonas carboxyditropha TaxID=2023338 RepID=UPI0013FDA8A6|nr:helix-turn-helix domain-containing protein [Pleomorphomonas carboxyditropha]
MFLSQYKAFDSTTIDAISGLYESVARGHIDIVKRISQKSSFRMHTVQGSSVSIFYLLNQFSTKVSFEPVDYIRFVFLIRGGCHLILGATKQELVDTGSAYIMPNDECAVEHHPDGYSSLALRVSPEALARRLQNLTDHAVDQPIRFDQPLGGNERFLEFVRRPLFQAARELKFVSPQCVGAYMEALETLLLTRIVLHAPHNYRGLVDRPPEPAGSSRLRKAEDYIQANWNRHMTTDEIAETVQISGRTLYEMFLKKHRTTPSQYLRKLRLEKARDMLTSGGETSTMSAAIKCGFSSFAHFARSYRAAFGELPSETLKQAVGVTPRG